MPSGCQGSSARHCGIQGDSDGVICCPRFRSKLGVVRGQVDSDRESKNVRSILLCFKVATPNMQEL